MIGTLQLAAAAALVVLGVIVVVRFERLCLDDLAGTPDVELQLFSRTGWLVLIVFFIPVGGVLYLHRGKA